MPRSPRRESGFTLVELMIAMVLGLIIVGAAISILLASRQTYRVNEALAQIQESGRMSFELLARDLREGGLTGCLANNRVTSTLNDMPGGRAWWQDWIGIVGFDGDTASTAVPFGSTVGSRVAGTDAILVQGLQGVGRSIENHQPAAANIKINAATTDIVIGDILIACDFNHATIFQVSNYNSNTTTVVHNTGGSIVPGNCSSGLGFPTQCSNPGNVYQFQPNTHLARFAATLWYVGNNGRVAEGGRSLFRVRLAPGGQIVTEELISGVVAMQVRYREGAGTVFVESPTVWANVSAVELTLTVVSAATAVTDTPDINEGRLDRSFTSIVALRNRLP